MSAALRAGRATQPHSAERETKPLFRSRMTAVSSDVTTLIEEEPLCYRRLLLMDWNIPKWRIFLDGLEVSVTLARRGSEPL